MTDDPNPSLVRNRGTSREYILGRLRREGFGDWAAAVESRRVSAYAIAVQLGWMKRAPTLRGENTNQAKRRRYDLTRALIG